MAASSAATPDVDPRFSPELDKILSMKQKFAVALLSKPDMYVSADEVQNAIVLIGTGSSVTEENLNTLQAAKKLRDGTVWPPDFTDDDKEQFVENERQAWVNIYRTSQDIVAMLYKEADYFANKVTTEFPQEEVFPLPSGFEHWFGMDIAAYNKWNFIGGLPNREQKKNDSNQTDAWRARIKGYCEELMKVVFRKGSQLVKTLNDDLRIARPVKEGFEEVDHLDINRFVPFVLRTTKRYYEHTLPRFKTSDVWYFLDSNANKLTAKAKAAINARKAGSAITATVGSVGTAVVNVLMGSSVGTADPPPAPLDPDPLGTAATLPPRVVRALVAEASRYGSNVTGGANVEATKRPRYMSIVDRQARIRAYEDDYRILRARRYRIDNQLGLIPLARKETDFKRTLALQKDRSMYLMKVHREGAYMF